MRGCPASGEDENAALSARVWCPCAAGPGGRSGEDMRGAFVLEGGRSGTCRKVELLRELKPGFEGAVVEGAEDVDASE